MPVHDDNRTIPVEEGAARLGVSLDWYMRQLRPRKLPGHKIGRTWRLTDDDIREALRLTAKPALVKPPDPSGLTSRSRTHFSNRQVPGSTRYRGQ